MVILDLFSVVVAIDCVVGFVVVVTMTEEVISLSSEGFSGGFDEVDDGTS